jgi:hypothetical protein
MKVGIDIHGVINTDPLVFSKLTKILRERNIEIHILTGPRLNLKYKSSGIEFNNVREELANYNITYDHIFSVLDYNIENNEDVWENEKGWWTSDLAWNKTKAAYCKRNDIDIHIDDTKIYGKYFETPFIHLTPLKDKTRIIELTSVEDMFIPNMLMELSDGVFKLDEGKI